MARGVEAKIKRLIAHHQLARVEITTYDGATFVACAFPARYGSIVKERTEAAFAALGKSGVSLAEATEVRDRAERDPVAQVSDFSVEKAIDGLAAAFREPGREAASITR
jgi:hypothetical protein